MSIEVIQTTGDYEATLKAIELLMNAKANTPQGDRLDALVTLVEAYEWTHFPTDKGTSHPDG
jgi:HTH-type transcriptional regulator / antitoxin HigA